ncbi:MAG: hypothetical protein V1779_17510 [bacterium]
MEITFNEVIENIESLPIPEQERVLDIIQNRINEYKRDEIVKDVKEGRQEYQSGKVKRGTIDDLLKDIEND